MITTAFVKIWGETIGAIAWNEKTGISSFEFNNKCKQMGWDLAPIKMPIRTVTKVFSFPELKPKINTTNDTFKGMPGLLADVLPDKYGTKLINIWLAQNGRPANSMNPIEQLCFVGNRGMGALEFEPANMKGENQSFKVEIDSLVVIAQKLLSQKETLHTNVLENERDAISDILKIGTSVGGARPKAVIAYNDKTGEVKSGQTSTPIGYEHWLIKLDGVNDTQFGAINGYGRVEMAYYNMAIASGIEMMESRLLEENGRAHFMTKRFDRADNDKKHHIQTWCAMQHFDFNEMYSYSYEQLFQTMRILGLPYPQAEQMFRRIVFNVLAKNCDDHTKNFAFRLKKDASWELAPAYDVCHAYKPGSIWVSQHTLSINGKRDNIVANDLITLAKSMHIRNPKSIIKDIYEKVSNWEYYAQNSNVDIKLSLEIANTLLKMDI
jgi:serine/threonine-protein kinase HipA